MKDVEKRDERGSLESFDTFSRLDHLFNEWVQALPFRGPASMTDRLHDQMIRVDQFRDGDTLVVKAEIPGIDPEEDVHVTVDDHTLRIRALRREEENVEEGDYVRRELRQGSFSRTLPLPQGVSEDDISATYTNGVLEVRVPMPRDTGHEGRTIPVTTG